MVGTTNHLRCLFFKIISVIITDITDFFSSIYLQNLFLFRYLNIYIFARANSIPSQKASRGFEGKIWRSEKFNKIPRAVSQAELTAGVAIEFHRESV